MYAFGLKFFSFYVGARGILLMPLQINWEPHKMNLIWIWAYTCYIFHEQDWSYQPVYKFNKTPINMYKISSTKI